MKRIMLKVAYDGTNYHGWQIQPNGETIEGVLNRCLSELLQEKIEVIGASRTDSGVHARENIAVFDTESPIPPKKVANALNARLPDDIRIQDSEEVNADFHPRKCVSRKTYEYRIYNAPFSMPTERLYSYFTYVPLDIEKMREAAVYFIGTHDFKSFCSVDTQAESTVRQVDSIEVNKDGNLIAIRVSGRGFLYNMVRIMAGTLMEVGRGRLEPADIARILEAKDRTTAGPTAPACGLTLIKYEFL
ncbi:MAG: tRNA pseudouridine(38-40) synthase TruA [Lachnospiraceae bacterium]|nr:tRNA pseudouridine(38-40) synthase TruA [Lachnospiraceae bacterium]